MNALFITLIITAMVSAYDVTLSVEGGVVREVGGSPARVRHPAFDIDIVRGTTKCSFELTARSHLINRRTAFPIVNPSSQMACIHMPTTLVTSSKWHDSRICVRVQGC